MAKYSYEFKLQVVQAYLDGEGGYRYLSKKYGVPSKRDSHTIHLPVQKPLRPLFLQDRFLQANLAAQHL